MVAKAEWTGVIELDGQELDCRLFSASGKPKPLPLRLIHRKCKTSLEMPKKVEIREKEEGPQEMAPVIVREQIDCPKCHIALKTDEIGRAAETEAGLIILTDEEVESLVFKPTKRVKAEFIEANDPSIIALGLGRQLYVLPKPASLQTYYNVFHILCQSNTIGFIPELVIGKTAYRAILQPITIPEVIFGTSRQVLVVEMLRDSDTLKDPGDFPDFPREIPPSIIRLLTKQIVKARDKSQPLDPERCVNPKRQRLKGLLKGKVQQALK